MQVLKFGGTSVGSVENMLQVKNIITDDKQKIVVLSAMSGTTNALVNIYEAIHNNDLISAKEKIDVLLKLYNATVNDLIKDTERKIKTQNYVESIFSLLYSFVGQNPNDYLEYEILAQGELLSTVMFNEFLQQEGVNSQLLSALDFMRIDRLNEPDLFYTEQRLNEILERTPKADVYITQGFICLNHDGKTANLQRGGSDYTATIIGAAIKAKEVQIWTDIDGMHNNDPRYVENTTPISNLSFEEAAELAYFGAKILHPQTVTPVRDLNIPIKLKNTLDPDAYGTVINKGSSVNGIKAIAAKDNITAIKIKSGKMLQAHGFLMKVFQVFETYETSIDMITTSEVAVSLTIDDISHLDNIKRELKKFAFVEIDKNQSIVCLVGHNIVDHKETFRLFEILKDVKIRMISYGGSKNNISLLVNTEDKVETLQKLNAYLFSELPEIVA